MIHTIRRILALTIIFCFYINVGFAQHTDETLPQKVIFKMEETHRASCAASEIKLIPLNKVFSLVGVTTLNKVFPHKKEVEKEGNVDLSLIYELTYQNDFSVADVIRMIKKLKLTTYVEPYYIPQLTYTPNDTLYANQYHINLIKANMAWDTTKGDTNITIGITDTGWETTHPDLIGNVSINYNDPINGTDDDGDGYTDNYMGWDLGNNDNDATWESAFHGVYVTGLAAATTDNVAGVAGVGFNTRFLPIKISNAAGILTHAYQGIVYAADHDCFIINCSWGSFSYSQFAKDVVDYAIINKGCLVVGAVGNDNLEAVFYPAGYEGVLSVANSNQNDLKSASSNYGYYVDVSSPGEGMWTTASNANYKSSGGTSMAAPVVSGGAALLKAQFPSYNNFQIAALLQATADDLNTNNPNYIDKIGSGRINLLKGMSATNVQFLAMTKHTATDNNDDNFLEGDTLSITAFFQNYLNPISATSVTISTSSPYVNIIDGTTNLAAMATLATTSNNLDRFKVEVLNGASVNEKVIFKAVITNGGYTNNEYFTVILNPDYINLSENLVTTSITSNGRIGFTNASNTLGVGFEYDGKQLLYEAGLMLGYNTNRVEDGVRGVSMQDEDFGVQHSITFNPPYISAKDLYSVFYDMPPSSSLGNVWVEQSSYAYAPNDKYIIIVYTINNISNIAIPNLRVGIFADWDIDVANTNKAGFDAARKMGYIQSLGLDTTYAGIQLLSVGNANNYCLDLDGSGGVSANGGFSTAEKYTTLSTVRNAAGGNNGGDVAHVVSSESFSLSAGEKKKIAFAILAGDSLLDLQASADAAQVKYNTDALSVKKIETINTFHIYPNPSLGLFTIACKETIEKVLVTNIMGEVVLTSVSKKINIANQPNGIYFVMVSTPNQVFSQKVVLLK